MMNEQLTIQLILCAVLGLCGYLCLLRFAAARTGAPTLRAAGILLALYAVIMGAFILIVNCYAGAAMLLPAFAALTVCVFAASAASCFQGRWRDVSVLPALLLLCYLAALASVTLLSRENSNSAVILLRFDALEQTRYWRSFAPMRHLLLNIVMFMPLGVLLPLAFPFSPTKLLDVLSTALLLTAMIEAGQLIWQLGQVDVEDLAANAAGALAGFAVYALIAFLRARSASSQQEW